MNLVRAFISGIALPSVLIPIFFYFSVHINKEMLEIPFIHIIPILWGFWNVLYFAIFKSFFPGDEDLKIIISGALLGFIIAIILIFWYHVPERLGLSGNTIYFPLLVAPILYAIIWRLVVKPLNKLVGL